MPRSRLSPLDGSFLRVQTPSAHMRLGWKGTFSPRADGLEALGLLPDPLRDRAARLAASPRLSNLTFSNVPGPRVPVFLQGCELREAAPVVPLRERHALSVGMVSHRDRLTLGVHADPTALPQVAAMPAALAAAVRLLPRPVPRPDARRRPRRPGDSRPQSPSRPTGAHLHAA